jgi:monofunctional glycosyltransferase
MRNEKTIKRTASGRKGPRRGGFFSFLGKIFLLIILIPVALVGLSLVYPNVGSLRANNPEKTSFMKFREKQWRDNGEDKQITQTWAPFSRISPNVVKAVIISEDDKFWTHDGFDIEAIEEAAAKNLKKKKFAYGGSTISQQLAKNLYLNPEKSVIRKARETILTWRLEHTLSKRRILELYLNVAEWGDGVFGIEAAAQQYYHRPASALSPSQAAHLAAILPNPVKWKPTGGSRLVERRAGRILAIMARRGVVLQEYEEVMHEQKSADPPSTAASDSTMDSAPGDSLKIR